MADEIKVEHKGIISDRALYLTADEREIVEKGDDRARFLLVGPNGMIDPVTVQRYGLSAKDNKVVIGKPGKDAEGKPLPGANLGTPNEGQIREPGEPLILVPRTGVMRPEPAPRDVPEAGKEVDVSPKIIAVSNVPPEDDELRARVAEETGGKEKREAAEKAAAQAAKPAARKATAKKSARKRGG
jgi:hypothetical protein